MVNEPIPALPLRPCATSTPQSCLRIFSPGLKSLGTAEFRKLSDIQRNSIRSQKAFGYQFEACLVSIALDERMLRKGTKDINRTNLRMRLIVLIALSTGMRSTEIHRLNWSDVLFGEGLIAVRARLKKGKVRYVPMPSELASEMKRYPAIIGEDRIFPPTRGENKSGRQRLEGSFDDLLERARIIDFRFHDLRHTFASWYMMNGGDLYELAKILGHANIKMTERYAKLGRQHITKTCNVAREMWKLMEQVKGNKESIA